jgi:antirestriction protein ArdC
MATATIPGADLSRIHSTISGDRLTLTAAGRPATMSNRERVAQAQRELAAAVAALHDSATWKRTLAVMARFPRYSANNQCLIAYQRPDATYVRGFRAWIDAGRAVRKGEKGIRILAPRPWSRVEPDDAGAERAASGISFTVVSVFDVGQTDPIPGHPHPWQPPQRPAATGDAATARALWNAMTEHAAALGLTVSTRAAHAGGPAVYGAFAPSLHRIWVRPDRALADMAATLAHELAHAVTPESCAGMTRDQREVVAESIAYAVGSRFGLDMTLRSAHYVATWLDDAETFKTTMHAIHAGAAALIDALDATLAGEALALAA